MALFYVVRWVNTRKLSYAFAASALLFMQMFLHGGIVVAGALLLVLLVIYAVRHFIGRLWFWALNMKSFIVVGGAVLIVIVFGAQLLSSNVAYLGSVISLLDSGTYITKAASFQVGDASYPLWLLPTSARGLLLLAPFRMLYLLFSPFPWDVTKASHLVGMFDGALYLALAWFMFKNRKAIWSNPATRVVFLILCCLVIVYTFGSGNFGTALRHRAKFVVLMIALAAPMIPRVSFRLRS